MSSMPLVRWGRNPGNVWHEWNHRILIRPLTWLLHERHCLSDLSHWSQTYSHWNQSHQVEICIFWLFLKQFSLMMVVKVSWQEAKWRQWALSVNAYHCSMGDGKALHLGGLRRNGKEYGEGNRDFFSVWSLSQGDTTRYLFSFLLNNCFDANKHLCAWYIKIWSEERENSITD